MIPDDMKYISVTEKPNANSEVKCPQCEQWSAISEWEYDEFFESCEICDNHEGMLCPKCGEWTDLTRHDGKIEVRQKDA